MDPSQNPFNHRIPDWFGSGYEPANPYSEQSAHERQPNLFLNQNFYLRQVQNDHVRQDEAQFEADLDGIRALPGFLVGDGSARSPALDEGVRIDDQDHTTMMTMDEDAKQVNENNQDSEQESEPEPAVTKKRKYKSTKTDLEYKEMKEKQKDKFLRQVGTLRGFYEKLFGSKDSQLGDAPLRKVMADAMEERGIGGDIDFVWERVHEFISAAHGPEVIEARTPKKPGRRTTGKGKK